MIKILEKLITKVLTVQTDELNVINLPEEMQVVQENHLRSSLKVLERDKTCLPIMLEFFQLKYLSQLLRVVETWIFVLMKKIQIIFLTIHFSKFLYQINEVRERDSLSVAVAMVNMIL